MQRGRPQNHFSDLKHCVFASFGHSFGPAIDEGSDHPSPVVFLYDFDTDCVYLYCPVCERAWLDMCDFQLGNGGFVKSAFRDFSRCVPATATQVAQSHLAAFADVPRS